MIILSYNIYSIDCSIEMIWRKNNCVEVCYKGVFFSLFRFGIWFLDLLKFFLGGVSGFSLLKGVFSFKFWFLVVVLFLEGGCEVFFGKGVKCLVDGLIGWLGKVKFFGFDKVCFCEWFCREKVDCFF